MVGASVGKRPREQGSCSPLRGLLTAVDGLSRYDQVRGAVTITSATQSTEVIHAGDFFSARRFGRYILVELLSPHRVISTSAHQGGQRTDFSFLANHQSCEASSDARRQEHIANLGLVAYHREVCAEMGVDPDRTALMGTAANMAYACHRWAEFDDVRADAIITAGVSGNAAKAGDPASWHEQDEGWKQVAPYAGTINVMLLLNCPLTASAQARAVVTLTEAKSSVLAELAVPSRYSATIATGTGTDQFCLAAPLNPQLRARDSTSPHTKLGEIIGTSVREALREALRWQNGLEPSYTRGIFHALGRFGLTEERAMASLARRLPEQGYGLLAKNPKAVFYEPGVAAAAHAFAAVLDRIAYGTLPRGSANDALRQQAACLACSLAARREQWPRFYEQLPAQPDDPIEFVLQALALGWTAKWT